MLVTDLCANVYLQFGEGCCETSRLRTADEARFGREGELNGHRSGHLRDRHAQPHYRPIAIGVRRRRLSMTSLEQSLERLTALLSLKLRNAQKSAASLQTSARGLLVSVALAIDFVWHRAALEQREARSRPCSSSSPSLRLLLPF